MDKIPAEFFVERASLHVLPDPMDRQFLSSVLIYLDGKEATARRLGAFSHLVHTLKPDELYLPNGVHFLMGHATNKEYVQTYLMFGGQMTMQVYAAEKLPILKNKLDFYPITSDKITTDYLYEKFEDDAPFYVIGKLTGHQIDQPDYSSYHSALVSAGIGARMVPWTQEAKMSFERLREIVDYLDQLPKNDNGKWMITLSHPLLERVIDLAEDYAIDLELLNQIAHLLMDPLSLDIDQYGIFFRIGEYSPGVRAQLLGLPIQEAWVDDKLINEMMERYYADLDDPVGRAKRINNATVTNLIERLSECYSIDEITTTMSGDDQTIMSFSPLDIFVFNEGPKIYVISRADVSHDIYVNPHTGNYLDQQHTVLLNRLLAIEEQEELLDPAPISDRLNLIKPTTSIFVPLNEL
ncbi:Hypothetical protein POVR1_LOCUS257 [uncultured virus]|nr:Hypothetical protein POVR1_LOCUS257 [uncultured virus]